MNKNQLMVSILKDGRIDTPQGPEETYFETLEQARAKGIELLIRFNAEVFQVIKLTSGIGHYRTLGYFNKQNEYIR